MGADAAETYYLSKVLTLQLCLPSGKGEELAKELGGFGLLVQTITKDIEIFFEKVLSAFNKVDVLVNSAGHGAKGDILELKDEDWVRGMGISFKCYSIIRIVTPIMQKQNNGSIINISTFAAFEPIISNIGVFRSGLASLPNFMQTNMQNIISE